MFRRHRRATGRHHRVCTDTPVAGAAVDMTSGGGHHLDVLGAAGAAAASGPPEPPAVPGPIDDARARRDPDTCPVPIPAAPVPVQASRFRPTERRLIRTG